MATLYRSARIFDGSDRLRDGHAVLVEGGRIARVAPEGEFAGFAGDVEDCAGQALLPGLIDCHMHLMLTGGPDQLGPVTTLPAATMALHGLKAAQSALMGGITTLRDVGGYRFIEMSVRDAINRGDLVGPTILCSGHIIVMTGGHAGKIGREADGPDELVKAVREQIKGGADLIKLMATGGVATASSDPSAAEFTEAEIAAACAEAKRRNRRIAAHAHGAGGIRNAVLGGVTSIEHGKFLDEETVALMVRHGVYLVPTLSVGHWTLQNRHRGTIPAHIVEKTEWARERHRESLRMFHAAGGKIAMGTDAGTQYNMHGDSAFELALMVEAGLPAADVLRSATSAAADLLGLSDRGRIAEGHVADLLLVAGDPLDDIRAAGLAANHRLVVKRGVVVKRS
ncbi:amidohydrolase family protein [Elioraea sp.]|uniref:metal-dependent hydrolase family protein n=1 Tax=Elioraea sp. TaxID=2185103 RepID=UPI003F70D941